jgi:hypothetical protein
MAELADAYPIPLVANATFLIVVFVVVCLIAHLILIAYRPLGKIGWKRVDYLWLPLTLLGVASTAGSNRQIIARQWLNLADIRFAYAQRDLERTVRVDLPAMACRTFIRTQYSPPGKQLDSLQQQYDAACAWTRKAAEHLPKGDVATRSALSSTDFATPEYLPSEIVRALTFAIKYYNGRLVDIQRLQKATERSEVELTLSLLGPALIAVALAVRITKVTGELQLERRVSMGAVKTEATKRTPEVSVPGSPPDAAEG